jgi:hypothetical protein
MDPDAAPVLSLALSAKQQPVKDITETPTKRCGGRSRASTALVRC